MAYQGFFLSKSPGNFHQINGFDPLIGMRIDMESSKPMLHFEQVYTSSHWMIRIFRVLSEDEDRDPLRQAQERYLNLIAQQTKKAKARQNVRDHDISYSDVPRESSDSRAYVRVTQDSAGNPQRRQVDPQQHIRVKWCVLTAASIGTMTPTSTKSRQKSSASSREPIKYYNRIRYRRLLNSIFLFR